MVDQDLFPYWDNVCHNAMLDHSWPCFIMIDFHMETMFVTVHRCTITDHDLFSYWDNLCHNATLDHDCHFLIMIYYIKHGWQWLSIFFHAWPWFTLIYHGRPWLILLTQGNNKPKELIKKTQGKNTKPKIIILNPKGII